MISTAATASRDDSRVLRHCDVQVDVKTERAVVLAIVALVILFRSAIVAFWPQAQFDSDQAVIGLMAKHLSEGRAFPMFLYGSNYILAVEAWTAAPVFKLAGVSVATLKLPLVVINLAIGFLLVRLLEREAGLRPALAAFAAVFFILPPPGTAGELLNVAGVNLEPFLYVLLVWMTRHRPAWCGFVVGLGFLQRELTIYAPLALLAIGAVDGALWSRDGWRRVVSAGRVAIEVWLVAAVVKTFSSAAGPGTTIADVPAANNVTNLLARLCFDPGAAVGGVGSLITVHWAQLFGLRVQPLLEVAIDSRADQGVAGSWMALAAAVAIALVRIAASIVANRGIGRAHYFPAYLVLVGLISSAALVVARCGAVGNTGYVLFTIFSAVGLSAWYLQVEQQSRVKTIWISLVTVWAIVAAVGHFRLWDDYLRHPPYGYKRLLVKELENRGIRYGSTDYWNAYYIAFLTNERIIMKSTGFDRIREYDRIVDAHKAEAVQVLRLPCMGPGGERILQGIYLCPPQP
jgi:hypothetical protein